MNIRDSYIHGADGKGVVKRLFFATAADVQTNSALHVNDLVFLLADTLGTQVPLTIPTLNQNTTGSADSLKVVTSSTNANHYLTFVYSNNATATAESFYTDGNLYYNPSTNILAVPSITVSASSGFNYSGIETASANSARPVWFAYDGRNGIPCINKNFKYNPSTNTLTVGALSGPKIIIGNTTLYINSGDTTNKLTPDTSITNLSTHGTIPSSKAVYDAILTGIQSNDAMIFKGFLTGGDSVANTTYTPGADRGHTYKVQTAGYINGEYYQVNDTFICTTDGTVAATSSNVSTVNANWGVVEGNGDYLNIHGGTMDGTLSWSGTTALPTITTASSVLVVDNNVTKQISLTNLLTSVVTSAVISNSASGTTQITANQSDPYYNLIEGGAIVRSIQFKHGSNMTISSTTGGVITFTASDTWRNIYTGGTLRVRTATNTKAMNFASSNLNITYLAAGTSSGQSGSANYFTINLEAKGWVGATSSAAGTAGYMPGAAIADRTKFLRGDGSWVALSLTDHTHTLSIAADSGNNQLNLAASTKYKLTAGGSTFIFTTPPNTWVANAVNVAGYVAAPTKAANPNQVWMTNADGVPAWRTVNVSSAAQQLFSGSKTLVVSTWEDMAAISTYSGTYAIQISSGNVIASGVFTACGGTDTVIDEIPLHVSDKGTNTWRPYARISGANLLMTTNEATGTARTYTIKILKLI